MENKHLSLKGNFEDIQDFNSTILVTKMKIFAFGKNLNLSSISQAAFESEKTRNSLFNIPVVAKFSENEDIYGKDGDLEGHNSKLSIDKNGNLTIVADTFPIGVIGNDSTITYEQVNEGTDEEPDFKTYVCVDRVYLWKRYDAVQKIQEWMSEGIAPKVSMEIGNMTGHYSKEQGAYVIESFEFEAVAALGSNVTPCFPMAQIESYSNQTFEEAYYSMLQELKFSLQQIDSVVAEEAQKGGTDLSKELETQEAIVVEEKQEQEQSTFEAEQPSPQDTVEEVIEQPVATFSLTSEQMESELRRELAEIETLTEVYWDEVYTSPRYYYRDHKPEEKIVIAMDDKNWFLVGFSYSVIGDAVEIDASSIARYKVDYNPMDLSGDTDDDAEIDAVSDTEVDPETLKDEDDMFSAFTLKAKAEFMVEAKEKAMKKQFEAEKEAITSELNAKLAELQEQYSTLESKMISLDAEMAKKIEEERKQAEDALFESFSTSLTEDEMAPIKNKLGEMSLQDAEEKLFALVGKKAKVTSATFSKVVDEEVKPIRYSIVDDSVKSKSDKPWADLIQIKE